MFYLFLISFKKGPEKFRLLAEINEKFISIVKNVGRIIVTERALPVEEKTFRPADVGGSAGGQKVKLIYFFLNFEKS